MTEKKTRENFTWEDLTCLIKNLKYVKKYFEAGEKDKAVEYFNKTISQYEDSNFTQVYVKNALKKLTYFDRLKRDYSYLRGHEDIDYSVCFTLATKGFLWDIGW